MVLLEEPVKRNDGQDTKRLKELKAENKRLKTIVADLTLDNSILKELAGNFYPRIGGAEQWTFCSAGLGYQK